MEEFQVQLRDGTIMKGHHWPTPNPEANYCMITGMQEYSARYDELARYLNDFHIEVWVLDAIGQGLNAPNPEDQMKWPENGFAKNVEGIHMMCLLARKNGLPTTQAGHSMGSFMTQRRLQVYPHDSDRTLIIGSNGGQACLMKMGYLLACLKVHKSNWDKPNPSLTKLSLGGYAKSVKNAETELDWLSYDEENRKAYAAHPYCGFPPTGGFWKELLRGVRLIWTKKELKRVAKDEQIFIIAGEEDPVGQFGKGPTWLCTAYQKLGVRNVTVKLYPHMRHEITNETERGTVFVDIRDFVLGK